MIGIDTLVEQSTTHRIGWTLAHFLWQGLLITGLLASVTLGLAVLGAYLIIAPTLEETS